MAIPSIRFTVFRMVLLIVALFLTGHCNATPFPQSGPPAPPVEETISLSRKFMESAFTPAVRKELGLDEWVIVIVLWDFEFKTSSEGKQEFRRFWSVSFADPKREEFVLKVRIYPDGKAELQKNYSGAIRRILEAPENH